MPFHRAPFMPVESAEARIKYVAIQHEEVACTILNIVISSGYWTYGNTSHLYTVWLSLRSNRLNTVHYDVSSNT